MFLGGKIRRSGRGESLGPLCLRRSASAEEPALHLGHRALVHGEGGRENLGLLTWLLFACANNNRIRQCLEKYFSRKVSRKIDIQ